jgi:hypothetical protein
MLLALVVLLDDPDPLVQAWACRATGNIVALKIADPFAKDLMARLLDLAESSPVVSVRIGAAMALHRLIESAWGTEPMRERISELLETLGDDISFRVRWHARGGQSRTPSM